MAQAAANRGDDLVRSDLAWRALQAFFDFGSQKRALFFRGKLFEYCLVLRGWRRER
jgi:hypothetical protein